MLKLYLDSKETIAHKDIAYGMHFLLQLKTLEGYFVWIFFLGELAAFFGEER